MGNTEFANDINDDEKDRGIEWNFVVVQFSFIMIMLGLPSMYFACFPCRHDELGPGIFAISLITIVVLMGMIYHTLTINAERSSKILDLIVSALEVYLIIAALQSVLKITEVLNIHILWLLISWIFITGIVFVVLQHSRRKHQS